MTMESIVVLAVSRLNQSAMLDDGTIIHFTTMFDKYSCETDDGKQATVAVAPLPNGKWVVIDLRDFVQRLN